MMARRLPRSDFATAILLGTLLVLELLDPLSVDVADGPEDEDGDANKRERPQKHKEHGSGDGVLCNGREKRYGAARPEKGDKRPRCYLRGSSYGELRRCLHPNAPLLIGGRGEAQQRVEGVLDGADFEGLRYAVGARKLGKRRCEPEPLVARHVERQDDEPRFRLRAENELDDVRVEPGVPVAARSQRLEPSKARKSASFSRNRSAIAS